MISMIPSLISQLNLSSIDNLYYILASKLKVMLKPNNTPCKEYDISQGKSKSLQGSILIVIQMYPKIHGIRMSNIVFQDKSTKKNFSYNLKSKDLHSISNQPKLWIKRDQIFALKSLTRIENYLNLIKESKSTQS